MSEQSFAAGLVGSVLDGRYRLDALLGEGGMGAVFRAHHLAMDRRVAVKVLKPHLTGDETALQRFAREARSTMRVDSPHAVKLLDFGLTPDRGYYMVLEYLDGRTVQRELDVDGAFAPARVLHVARQALHALGAAHASGLVHRDIKPENILLLREGDDPDYTKLLDFGVAKLMEGAARSERSALAITAAGMVFGTPEYMSPEQACGLALDGRSDLYSLAATMFVMLTGCALYDASSALEWLTKHATQPAPRLANVRAELAGYPDLDRVLQRCLAKRREDRPASAAEMIGLLDAVEPTLARPGVPAGSRTAAATALGLRSAASTYIAALPAEAGLRASGSGLRAEDAAPPTTTAALAASRRSRRGLWLVAGTIVVAVAGVAVLAARPSAGRPAPGVRRQASPPIADAGTQLAAASRPGDASSAGAAPVDAPAPAPAPKPEVRSPKPETRPQAAVHLAAAEAARRERNYLVELSEADAALQLDPHSVRARLLMADALLGSGDLERGCKYLRDLGRFPAARTRARQAGCPP